MNQNRFVALTRVLRRVPSRRDVLLGLAGAGLGLKAAPHFDLAEAKKKRRRKSKFKKAKPNAFGCLDVGDACKRASQCCSGICKGKKGRKRCKAHDTGGCRGANLCSDPEVEGILCTTSAGVLGHCGTTTGDAGYCVGGGDCFPCARDADCREVCGPQAACIQCPEECDVGTVCAGPDGDVCPL